MAAIELLNTPLYTDANLQGYYRLESSWNDNKNSNNLTATNSPTFATGKFGNAGSFASASSQYSTVNAFEYTDSFTWMCWFNRTSGTDGAILSKTNSGATVLRRLYVNGDTTISFNVDGVGSVSSASHSTGTTYFLAGVFDNANDKLKIWLNDTKVESGTLTGTPSASTGNFSLARDGSFNGNYFNGWIDDVAIFNRALTDLEIQNYYNGAYSTGAILLFL